MSAKAAPVQLPTLPSVDDSSWAAPFGTGTGDLWRLQGYVENGRPVWWRRDGFFKSHTEVEPKWHLFGGRIRSEDPHTRWDFTWKALCNYQHVRTESLFDVCQLRVTAPKKDDRCLRCAAVLAEIKRNTSK